jgi:uncharacterized protein YqjF (DUF2071 family)
MQISPDPDTRILHPIQRQNWRDVTFLHWRADPAAVRRLLPAQLELDLFEGECWIGLVPFRIENLSTPRGPHLPWLSDFPETNVRAYVIGPGGQRGVWFFSLDAARWPAVAGARAALGLPYYWAWMTVTRRNGMVRYSSRRLTLRGGQNRLLIGIGEPIPAPSAIEIFLTARFRLYAKRRGRLIAVAISHQRWPLQRATVRELKQDLVQKAGIPPEAEPPLAHFAEGVDVLVDAPTRL